MLAFLSDGVSESVLRSLATTMGIASSSVMGGGVKAAVKYLEEHRSPKILFIDLSESELPISDVNELSEVCEPGVIVIALGTRNDVGLFRELLSLGISDYLVKPVSIDLIRRTLAVSQGAAEQDFQGIRSGRLVSVLGVRGGVGATTIAVNSSWILANERSKRVSLIDLDIQFGNVNLFLDLKPSIGFRQVLQTPDRVDSTFIERTMTKHSERLSILSGEEPLDELTPFSEKSLEILLPIVRNQFHYVVLDLPRTVSSTTLYALRKSSIVVLVCDLTILSVREVNRLLGIFQNDTVAQRIIIVANKSHLSPSGEISKEEFEKAINRPVNHTLLFQPNPALEALNLGQPVVRSANSLTQGLRHLVDDITGGLQLAEESPTLWTKLGDLVSKISGS
jgi:pilus assembly protein CpaE